MNEKKSIGILGAMEPEVKGLIARLENPVCETVSGVKFYTGYIYDRKVTVAKCGVGKVFASLAAEAMILRYAPDLLINTGTGGAIGGDLRVGDVVVANRMVQHDMDTSPIGDPRGMVSGINVIYFPSDEKAAAILLEKGREAGLPVKTGTIATGDRFVADREDKLSIAKEFDAEVCEMEGGAIAHVAYVNATPCCVIRAISDNADGSSGMDYFTFLPLAAERSTMLTDLLLRYYD